MFRIRNDIRKLCGWLLIGYFHYNAISIRFDVIQLDFAPPSNAIVTGTVIFMTLWLSYWGNFSANFEVVWPMISGELSSANVGLIGFLGNFGHRIRIR